jgi:hypothetical protein
MDFLELPDGTRLPVPQAIKNDPAALARWIAQQGSTSPDPE